MRLLNFKKRSQNSLMDEVLAQLEKNQLSTIPTVLARILNVSRNPMSHASDLASICEIDKATSARLLKAANSVYFATENRDRVDSIKEAIVRIGFRYSEEIIMSASVASLLRSTKPLGDYTSSGLWKHSVAVAIASRIIFEARFGESYVDPFTAGLMHDVGIAVEHQFLYDKGFAEAILRRNKKDSMLVDEERDVLGFSHEEVGEMFARRWNFPDHLVEVIGHHHDLKIKDKMGLSLAHVVRLSEYLTHVQQYGYSDFPNPYLSDLLKSKSFLGVTDAMLEEYGERLADEMHRMISLGWFSELRMKLA